MPFPIMWACSSGVEGGRGRSCYRQPLIEHLSSWNNLYAAHITSICYEGLVFIGVWQPHDFWFSDSAALTPPKNKNNFVRRRATDLVPPTLLPREASSLLKFFTSTAHTGYLLFTESLCFWWTVSKGRKRRKTSQKVICRIPAFLSNPLNSTGMFRFPRP